MLFRFQEPFSIQYGSGAASGHYASDVVSVGGIGVQKYKFAVATEINMGPSYNRSPYDGLVGMGFQSLSTSGSPPLFESLYKANNLEPKFGFYLGVCLCSVRMLS